MDVDMERFDQLILSVSQEVCARNCNLYRDCLGISVGNFWTLCQMAFMDGTLPNPLPEGWGVSDDTGSGTTQEVGSESNINQGFLNCYRRIRPPTQRPTTSPTSSPTNKPSQSPTISSPSTAPSSHMPSVAPTFTTLAPTKAPSFTPVTSAPSIQPTIQPTLPHPTKAPTTLLEIPIHTINDDFRYVFPGVCKDANGDDFDGIIIRDVGNTQACADHCARYNACLGFTWFPTGLMCSLMFQDETWPKEYLLFNWALSDTGDGHTCIIGDFEQTTNVEFFQCFKRLRDPICATQIVVTSTTTELQTTLSPSISPSTTTTTTTTTTLKPTSSVSNCDDLQDDTDAYVQCLKNRISSLENRVDNMETTCRSYCDNLKNEIEFSLLRNSCDS